MVLLGLGTTWGCTQWLHREDYTVFELGDNPDGKMEGASVASSRVRASADEPSQYWLIGFKDRRLEREYLEDLVDVSSSCFFVGSSLALLLYVALPLASAICMIAMESYIRKTETGPIPVVGAVLVSVLPFIIVSGLGILAAFIVCCLHSIGRWTVRKDVILYVIEGGYLLYTGALIWIYLDPGYSGLKGISLSCYYSLFFISSLTVFFL